MTNQALSSFDVTGWEQTPYDEQAAGPSLARGTVRKTFRGDLVGESTAEILMCQADAADPGAGAGYVASERVVGRLGDLEGTFVLQHWGVRGDGMTPHTAGYVVPGSGTGDLAGLSGEMEITVDADGAHTLRLDYDIA